MPPQLARSMTSCPLRPGERAADQFFRAPMPKCNLLGRLRAAAASPVEFTNNVTKGVRAGPQLTRAQLTGPPDRGTCVEGGCVWPTHAHA